MVVAARVDGACAGAAAFWEQGGGVEGWEVARVGRFWLENGWLSWCGLELPVLGGDSVLVKEANAKGREDEEEERQQQEQQHNGTESSTKHTNHKPY